jgi:hypothetical protein
MLGMNDGTVRLAMFVKVEGVTEVGPAQIRMRCPSCRTMGTFDSLGGNEKLLLPDGIIVGSRSCPNPNCRTHVFVAYNPGPPTTLVAAYPPELLDFDPTNVPTEVIAAFEEAVTCHASECFVASAIMVRKTLEELCAERGATGANLKARIQSLGTTVVLPKELLDGLDDLRLLGNDAAHIESNVYNQIGKEEVEIGIEFTKEVLKAVYQYSALLGRLRALKAQNP